MFPALKVVGRAVVGGIDEGVHGVDMITVNDRIG